jgi:hypothetical protein
MMERHVTKAGMVDGRPSVASAAAWLWLDKSLWRGMWKMEKRDILAHETIHKNFYHISMNCDSGTAARPFLRLLSIFAAILPKFLCMKHLHMKQAFPNQG